MRKSIKYFLFLFLSSKRFKNLNIQLNSPKINNNNLKENVRKNYKLYPSSNQKNASINIKRNKFLYQNNIDDVDYVYGLNSVYSVLKKNERTIKSVIINKNIKLNRKIHKKTYEYVFNTIKERNIEIKLMDKNKMNELVGGFLHNDIIMKASYRIMKNYNYFIKNINKLIKSNIYICLHDVYDNMNIGNICRSIYFFGGNIIFLKKKKKVNEKKNQIKIDTPILHSSVGSSEYLEFFHINDMDNFMSEMKKIGFTIYSTSCLKDDTVMEKYIDLKNIKIKNNDKILIILGNESKGLSENILKNSDFCIYINSKQNRTNFDNKLSNENNNLILDSLNVSNVCSIVLHHFH
ncbi:apicoplast RNA methyltransferase precursor, putative [Plasmodium gallinaceum]|uniref:rRNA methyltransferase 1, mitochondrial n=1 Tax=Plasmodium gallinaceum TaxID=5849 RepID=A0A1J1GPL9_PLAGA|nr:apicoplast RNA methyltransferase precursor, putative [Plasmodium gallinaceum]CRG94386.1 apicoplast RNA methyltransferase precursor, putative [Plasmodium gallinaceum]